MKMSGTTSMTTPTRVAKLDTGPGRAFEGTNPSDTLSVTSTQGPFPKSVRDWALSSVGSCPDKGEQSAAACPTKGGAQSQILPGALIFDQRK